MMGLGIHAPKKDHKRINAVSSHARVEGKDRVDVTGAPQAPPEGRPMASKPPLEITGSTMSTMSSTGNHLGTQTLTQLKEAREKRAAGWKLEKKILSYHCYRSQELSKDPDDAKVVRKLIIQYFIEDDMLRILEPPVPNSGLPSGILLRKARVPKKKGKGFVRWKDLTIGADVEIFQVRYHIYDADEYTRRYCENQGAPLGPAEPEPDVPSAAQKLVRKEEAPRKPKVDMIGNFLHKDRKVLRFLTEWDGGGEQAEKRRFKLHYFLVDGTIEVLEDTKNLSGRDPFPVMLKRTKLPKPKLGSSELYQTLSQTMWARPPAPVAAVNPSQAGAQAAIVGSAMGKFQSFVEEHDLGVGRIVDVFGRKMTILACDAFTRDYYRDQHGLRFLTIEELGEKEEINAREEKNKPKEVPPYNGWGREEDTVQNVGSLNPKPPRRDISFELGNASVKLTFVAKLVTKDVHDKDRRFRIFYHIADGTIAIFEDKARNAGRLQGKFLERTKVKRPGTEVYFTGNDFYMGAKVDIFGRTFNVFDADEFTLKYMEDNSTRTTFPYANASFAHDRLGDVLLRQEQTGEMKAGEMPIADTLLAGADGEGNVRVEDLADDIRSLNIGLVEHEVVTLMRFWKMKGDFVSVPSFLDTARRVSNGDIVSLKDKVVKPQARVKDTTAEGVMSRLVAFLQRRGVGGPQAFESALAAADPSKLMVLSVSSIDSILSLLGAGFSYEEVEVLCSAYIVEPSATAHRRTVSYPSPAVDYRSLLRASRGSLPANRQGAVEKIFKAFDRGGLGIISTTDMVRAFRPRYHPRVRVGELSPAEATDEMLSFFSLDPRRRKGNDRVKREDFFEYFLSLSNAVASDEAFVDLVSRLFFL